MALSALFFSCSFFRRRGARPNPWQAAGVAAACAAGHCDLRGPLLRSTASGRRTGPDRRTGRRQCVSLRKGATLVLLTHLDSIASCSVHFTQALLLLLDIIAV